MIKAFLKITFLLTVGLTVAQPKLDDYDLKIGPVFKVSKRSVPIKFIGNDSDGFYFYYGRGKFGGGKKVLASFNYDLTLKGELELDQSPSNIEEKWESVNVIPFKGEYHHITTLTKYTSLSHPKFKEIYFQKIDPRNLTLDSKVLLTTINSTESDDSYPLFNYSPDSGNLLMSYKISTQNAENKYLGLHLYDANFNVRWETKIELPYKKKLLEIEDYCLDTKGNVYALGKRYYNKAKDKVKGEANYDYLIFKFNDKKLLDSIKVEPQGKFAKDLRIGTDDEDNLVVAGFYSEKNLKYAGGIFYLKMDGSSNEILAQSFKEFDSETLTTNMSEAKIKRIEKKLAKGKEVELPFYYIDEFIIGADGKTKIIAETRHIYTTTVYSPNGSYSTTNFDYGDIMVIEIDEAGEIAWVERVAKNQHTQNDGAIFSSYSSAIRNGDIYLVYNDNAANLGYSGVGRVAPMIKGSTTTVMVNKVNEEGVSKKTGLLSRGDVGTRMRPKLSYQVSSDEMLLFGYKGLKNQRFILMKFK